MLVLPATIRRAVLPAAVLAVLLAPAGAHAATLHVDDDSTAPAAGCGAAAAPCASLADAAAVAAAGDVLELASGTYSGATFAVPVTLRVAGTAAQPANVTITGNRFAGGAIAIGAGVASATISGNEFTGGTRAAISIDDHVGTGPTGDVAITGNQISGYRSALQVTGDEAGAVLLRANRVVGLTGTWVINVSSSAAVDARANWWGRNAGVPATHVVGADVRDPLRLELAASEAVLPGGTALVSARLVVPSTGAAETGIGGFAGALVATDATLDSTTARFRSGTASALLTAGTALGDARVTITLDGEQATATTKVVTSIAASAAAPGEANAAPVIPRFLARIRVIRRGLSRALSGGISQVVFTNRPASTRTTISINYLAARTLGLRPRSSHSLEDFIVGSARTRMVRGRRAFTVRLTPRAQHAIRRTDRRVGLLVHTQVRTRTGAVRERWYRIVLPGDVR